MGGLAERLTDEMTCETVFTIPLFGGIEIDEAVVVTWIIIAVLTLLSIFLTRNLRVENPSKRQLALETVIGGLRNFFQDILGEEGRQDRKSVV